MKKYVYLISKKNILYINLEFLNRNSIYFFYNKKNNYQ